MTTQLAKTIALAARGASLRKGNTVATRCRSNTRTANSRGGSFTTLCAVAKESWYPGSPGPEYLDGTLPGDYGFDPLGLSAEPDALKWNQQAELMHCRWAMLGTAGCLGPEIMTKVGLIDVPTWFNAGAGASTPYFTDGMTLFVTQMILMNWVEVRRWMDMKNPGCVNEDPIFKGRGFKCTGTEVGYPGGAWFNPLNMGATPENLAELKTKEIKNGRLAMLAMFGFAAQAYYTGEGPVSNYLAHLADPNHTTLLDIPARM